MSARVCHPEHHAQLAGAMRELLHLPEPAEVLAVELIRQNVDGVCAYYPDVTVRQHHDVIEMTRLMARLPRSVRDPVWLWKLLDCYVSNSDVSGSGWWTSASRRRCHLLRQHLEPLLPALTEGPFVDGKPTKPKGYSIAPWDYPDDATEARPDRVDRGIRQHAIAQGSLL